VLPANIYMAQADFFGPSALARTALWLRVLAQFPLIWFVVWATGVVRTR